MNAVDPAIGPSLPATWVISEPVFEADALNPGLDITPWQGHRDFAYDLGSFLRPRQIVELGVHYGCSFFAFCQVVKDRGLSTRVVGVDTFKGDFQAGFYGEEVFELVTKTKARSFSDERFLLRRETFDQGLCHVADASVDILHIDGEHTYKAVMHDFTTWLPKLAPDGIVLMHDIAVSTGFGSAHLWTELRSAHPHFEFPHAWGLGILFPKGERIYDALLREGFPDKMRGYRYRGELLLAQRCAAIDLQAQCQRADRACAENERLKADMLSMNSELAAAHSELAATRQRAEELERSLAICTLGLSRLKPWRRR